MAVCERCGAEFEPRSRRPSGALRNPVRRTCSRKCSAALSWETSGSRSVAISQAQKRRRAELIAQNHRRWARPGEREKLSERNRQMWRDPEMRTKLAAAISADHQANRKLYADIRRTLWRDPEYRRRAAAAIAASKGTPEARALFSALLRERWQDPVWREKWLAATRRRYRKLPVVPLQPLVLPVETLPPIVAPAKPISDARMAELDAIAEFMRTKQVKKITTADVIAYHERENAKIATPWGRRPRP